MDCAGAVVPHADSMADNAPARAANAAWKRIASVRSVALCCVPEAWLSARPNACRMAAASSLRSFAVAAAAPNTPKIEV